jgi:hypothetical protein
MKEIILVTNEVNEIIYTDLSLNRAISPSQAGF